MHRLGLSNVVLGILTFVAVGCSPTPGAPSAAPTSAPAAATSKPVASSAPAAAAASASPAASTSASPAASVSASPAAPASSPAAAPTTTAAAPAASGARDHVAYATTTGSSTSAGVYIALARGYFTDVNIDLEIVPFGGGADMISSIAASQIDVANTDAGAGLINAIARNLPIKFVADGARCIENRCNSALVVRKDLVDSGAFKDVADLKGMNVNTYTPGSTLNMFSYRTLEQAKLSASDIKEQNIAFADVMPAFSTRSLDANFLIEPFTTLAVAQGLAVKWKDTSQLLGPQQSTVIAFSPTFATQRQDVGKRFMVAYLRGIRDFIDAFESGANQVEMLGILTSSTTLKDPSLWKNVPQWFDANGEILLGSLKESQQWYVSRGFIQTPVDLDKVWDSTYVDYATGVVGKR